jgi:hypothetical protein
VEAVAVAASEVIWDGHTAEVIMSEETMMEERDRR